MRGDAMGLRGPDIQHKRGRLVLKLAPLKVAPPDTVDGIEKDLGSGMTKGAGPKRVERITAG